MIIYIDCLFLTNFFMDSVLLLITGIVQKKYKKIYRILLSATFLSLYGTIVFLTNIHTVLSAIFLIFSAIIGIFISFGREYIIKNTIIFLILSILCGGIVFALSEFSNFGRVTNSIISCGAFYMNINPFILICGCGVLYVFAEFLRRTYIKNFSRERILVNIFFMYNNKEYKIHCLIDTGCSLTEPLSGEAMLIIDNDIIKNTDGAEICVNTVNGKSKMSLIFPDRVWAENPKIYLYPKTPVAIARSRINKDGLYNGILNPDAIIFNGKEAEKCSRLI